MPDALAMVQALDQLPLLGASKARARGLVVELAEHAAAHPDPLLEAVVARHLGALARVEGRANAVPQLARAARLLSEQRPEEAPIARLRVARALVGAGREEIAARILAEFDAIDPRDADLWNQWTLLRVELGVGEALPQLDALLDRLPSPRADHERVAVRRRLAERWRAGGDVHVALEHLTRAQALAERHRDVVLGTELSLEAAALLMTSGRAAEAEAHARTAASAASAHGDDVALVAAAALLGALALARRDWDAARAAARLEHDAAARRHNWLAVADAGITASTALLMTDGPAAAIPRLVETGNFLRDKGARAATELLKGRLAELRATLGADVFDPLLWSA